jgi:hypothetical protein
MGLAFLLQRIKCCVVVIASAAILTWFTTGKSEGGDEHTGFAKSGVFID